MPCPPIACDSSCPRPMISCPFIPPSICQTMLPYRPGPTLPVSWAFVQHASIHHRGKACFLHVGHVCNTQVLSCIQMRSYDKNHAVGRQALLGSGVLRCTSGWPARQWILRHDLLPAFIKCCIPPPGGVLHCVTTCCPPSSARGMFLGAPPRCPAAASASYPPSASPTACASC